MPVVKRKTAARTSSARRRITAEDLLRLQYLADAQISPDGREILFVCKHIGQKNEYITNLWKVRADGKEEAAAFTSGGVDRSPRWSLDGSQVAFVRAMPKHRPQIHLISAAGGEAMKLTDFPEGSIGSVKWSPDGKSLAVSFREADPELTEDAKKAREEKGLSTPPRVIDDWWYRLDGDGYFLAQRYRLYVVDADTGAHRAIYSKDTLGMFDFDFSPDSRELVISTNRDPRALARAWKSELLRLNVASGKLTRIPNLPVGPKVNAQWSPDGKWIAYAGRIGKDDTYSTENLELFVWDAKSGKPRSLTGKTDYCMMAVTISDTAEAAFAAKFFWSPDSKRVFFRLGWHGTEQVASVPVGGGKITQHTRGAIDSNPCSISADGSRLALTVSTFDKPAEVGVIQLRGAGKGIRKLTTLNQPLLRELDLMPLEQAWVQAEDGTKVQVWWLRPHGLKRGKRAPAVLEVHGGPHGQYGVGFFHEFHVLAAAGYAVFFSNPRGSKGYGRDFCAAIRGNWGGPDWMDVQAVTGFIKRQRFVNPKRVGIMGGSYGGYMTNWAVSHSHDYKAAITDRCVSNLVSMFGSSDYPGDPDRYWPGNAWDEPEVRWEQSPLKYFGNVKTPMLIIHSEGDLRCNVEQAEQVFTALKVRGVPTRFVRYPSSTFHGMSRNGPPDLRLHRLHQIMDWWKQRL